MVWANKSVKAVNMMASEWQRRLGETNPANTNPADSLSLPA